MTRLENLPSPYSVPLLKKSKAKESPMVLAHFSKGELASLDKLQGGRTMDKKYGIPHYKALKHIFDNPQILSHLERAHKSSYATGGAIKHVEAMKAKMGRMGDTVRAAIPRNMAIFMDKLGLSTKNPVTKDREYALGSSFINSLGSYLPSMSTMGSALGGVASGLSSPAAGSTSSTATPTSGASGASSGLAGAASNLLGAVTPQLLDMGTKYLTGNRGKTDTSSTSPQTSAPAPSTTANPSTGTASSSAQNPSADMMKQMQDYFMSQGGNYLNQSNNPMARLAGSAMSGYQTGGYRGMANNLVSSGMAGMNHPALRYAQQFMPQFQQPMDPNVPRRAPGMPAPQYQDQGGYDDGGDYSPEEYTPPPVRRAPAPTRRIATSRRTGYR